MKIKFYGTRGSIPSPSMGDEFITAKYGGNTSCVFLEAEDGTRHILDAGSGIRVLGLDLLKEKRETGVAIETNLYVSHTHWDHIQGFPFFVPAYDPTSIVRIYGEKKVPAGLVEARLQQSEPPVSQANGNGHTMQAVLEDQQKSQNFPAPLVAMRGIKAINDVESGETIYKTPTLEIETMGVNHPGGCLSYRFTETTPFGKKVFVYCTDFEPDNNGADDRLIQWWANADLVVADAQYEQGSAVNNFVPGWGHSDYKTDVDMASKAGVKKLVLTHHEPKMDDTYHLGLEERAQTYAQQVASGLEVLLAKEGETHTL